MTVSLGLVLPAASSAAPPSAVTLETFSTGPTTATVEGEVNPEGEDTNFLVRYDVAGSTWCTSGGTSGSAANTAFGYDVGFDSNSHQVLADLTGLSAGTGYCAHLIALNGDPSQTDGGQVEWIQGTPTADTFDAVSNDATHAHVEGDVNPAGGTTTYEAEYDLASSTWCVSDGTTGSPGNVTTATSTGLPNPEDGAFHDVAVELAGLTEGASYCAEIAASNPQGSDAGIQVEWIQGSPTVHATGAAVTGTTTATFTGEIDPIGRATTLEVQYDLAGSVWCASDGASGAPSSSTLPADLGFTGFGLQAVSINLTGLSPSTSYCGELVATNQNGANEDGPSTWTQQSPPPPVTLTVSLTGGGSGTVTSSPPGIVCGSGASACSSGFAPGTQVTLTASPAAGSLFLGWLRIGPPGVVSPCSGSSPTCTFTLTSSQSVRPAFELAPTGEVSIALAGDGSGTVMSSPSGINCGSTCSHAFPLTGPVTLTATAAPGSTFAGWAGGGCVGTETCTNIPPLVGVMAVTATFTKNPPPPPKPVQCVVPKLKGKRLAAAKTALRKRHCGLGKVTKVKSTPRNKGRVIAEKPKPGKHLRKGAKVGLRIGK